MSRFDNGKTLFKVGSVHFSSWGQVIPYYARTALAWWNGMRAEQGAALGGCTRCGSFYKLHDHPAMTCYAWDGKGRDPNGPTWLCEPCGFDHDDFWEGQWAEYHASQG